jgi:predicted transcriptional regulator
MTPTFGQSKMSDGAADKNARNIIIRMAGDVVAAYLSNNRIQPGKLPDLIHSVYNSLNHAEKHPPVPKPDAMRPAVPTRRSVTPDYIVCLEDGKKLKVLKRHLRTTYNMTPEEYRAKWSLPSDYPMVAPNYAAHLSRFAKKIGLGHKGTAKKGGRSSPH